MSKLPEAFYEAAKLADLMRPGLEALPLCGNDWHDLSLRVKRNEDGTLAVHGMRLARMDPPKPSATAVLSVYARAMQAAGVPHEPLQVYDSNSYRRVGLASQYREVMWPANHPRDGHADITGEDVLRALVAAFNAMLELRRVS